MDRIFGGGAVFTGVRERPWADALAIRGADVLGVGSFEELREAFPASSVEDVAGWTILPGLIDAHNHFLSTGESLASIDLRYPGVGSADALLAAIRDAATGAAPGETIGGFGFDHAKYALPSRADLDAAAGDHPMHLFHTSGHHVLVNSRVLEAAGVDDRTSDPPGGRFDRDADGHLTGLCLDTACGRVLPTDVDVGSHGPNFHVRAPLDTLVAAVGRAGAAYLEAGLTCVADAQVTARELGAYRVARARGALAIRVVCMPLSHQLEDFASIGLAGPFGDERLSIGHLKVYADGTLTGGTAAFREELGIASQEASFFHEPDELVTLIRRAWTVGWRVAVHAQGDRAISLVLDGFEAGVRAAPRPDPRPRIEHAGYPGPGEVGRMRSLGAIAVNQPSYLFDYGDEYLASLGERAHELQPWRTELDADVRVVISSDSDVSSYRPLTTIANAMRRETRSGVPLGARHRLSLEEALFAHTADAAYTVGLEGRIGALEPGKAADLTIVGADLRGLAPGLIAEAPIAATLVDGVTMFERAS
jgi:predicted amidohydrolase YtcJ